MGLKHIIKELIRVRKHVYNLQTLCFVENLRPLYGCHRLNRAQFLHKNFLRNFTTKNNNTTIIYSNDSEELENDDIDPDRPNIRNILYKNSTDPLMQELNECASVQDVFNIIRDNNESMDHVQVSQAVLVLWDLQKIFYKHNIYYENGHEDNIRVSSELHANAILKMYITQVNSHQDFDTLIELIIKNYEKFSLDALTCTLLYLQRMGVAIKTNVMQLMISRCEREIRNCDKSTFPLTALSRFIVTIYRHGNLYPILLSIDALAIVLQRLEKCSTKDDFKLLTICLFRMKQLLTLENLETYKKIALKLVNEKKVTNENSRTILKALRFLSYLQWQEYNIQCTNTLMQLLKNSISQLNSRELITIFKIFQIQKEPADMLEELQEHALYQISNLEEDDVETVLDLLSCVVSFCSPLEKLRFEKLTRRYIENNLSPACLGAMYKILYHTKPSDPLVCNTFWDKCFDVTVRNGCQEDLLRNTLTLCSKYIHFSQDIGHKYRYEKFEEALVEVLVKEMHTLESGAFFRIASFIIAYSKDASLDEKLLEELVHMSPLFDVHDVLNISKGMQIALQHKYTGARTGNHEIWQRFQVLSNALNQSISREIQTDTKLPIVNLCLRSFVTRKCSIHDDLFGKMLEPFVAQSQHFNSHIVKDLSFYLQINSYLRPDVVDKMADYVVDSDERLLGSTVEKVLQLCYFLGYCPTNAAHFFDVASKIILRDQERFTGLTFLQTSLALCYFHSLPEVLIKQIFSVGFLEKLDEELSNCYAKTTYPSRVRDHMMQLNRAVCLDYPQSSVPWFHEKYIETEPYIKQFSSKSDFFHKQVHTTLQDVLKETQENVSVNVNVRSPYGYHLNFELTNEGNEAHKTAILLLKSNCFTNCAKHLKGYFQLKQRHLEILGYNVVNINYDEWKTFYIQQHCIEYVTNKLPLLLHRNI